MVHQPIVDIGYNHLIHLSYVHLTVAEVGFAVLLLNVYEVGLTLIHHMELVGIGLDGVEEF